MARWDAFSTQVNAGNVYYVDCPWVKDYIEEMRFAPFASHDDQMDASAGAFNMLVSGKVRVGGLKKHDPRRDAQKHVSSAEKVEQEKKQVFRVRPLGRG